jgi:hypothetical protein
LHVNTLEITSSEFQGSNGWTEIFDGLDDTWSLTDAKVLQFNLTHKRETLQNGIDLLKT